MCVVPNDKKQKVSAQTSPCDIFWTKLSLSVYKRWFLRKEGTGSKKFQDKLRFSKQEKLPKQDTYIMTTVLYLQFFTMFLIYSLLVYSFIQIVFFFSYVDLEVFDKWTCCSNNRTGCSCQWGRWSKCKHHFDFRSKLRKRRDRYKKHAASHGMSFK